MLCDGLRFSYPPDSGLAIFDHATGHNAMLQGWRQHYWKSIEYKYRAGRTSNHSSPFTTTHHIKLTASLRNPTTPLNFFTTR
jgi:hypothetical protein